MSKDISKAAGSLVAEGLAAEHLAAGNLVAEAPLVSVVIPVYNVRRYLQQCLESAIAQTYRNLEIIIIDDGSTDGSGSICDQYAERDGRIHVIHSTNRGLASARNLGLENAQGQLISFLDSDDWIEPHAVETLVRTAQLTGSAIIDARSCRNILGKQSIIQRGQNIAIHTAVRTSCQPLQKDGSTMWCGTSFTERNVLTGSVFPKGAITRT